MRYADWFALGWMALVLTAAPVRANDDAQRGLAAEIAVLEQQLREQPERVDLLLDYGAGLRSQRRHAEAAAAYERVLALEPEHEAAGNLLAMVLLLAAEDSACAEAIPRLARAAELAPDSQPHRLAYLERLAACERRRELLAAYEALPPGARLPVTLLTDVAAAYRETQAPETAATLYQAILDAVPEHFDAALGLALSLGDARRYEDAARVIDQALEHHPDNDVLLLTKAAVHWKAGTHILALDAFDRILPRTPAHADAVNLKAQLLAEMGCTSLAREVAEQHPALVSAEVRAYIERRMAEARLGWKESEQATNILVRLVPDQLLALCYHDITAHDADHPLQTQIGRLVEHIEYLRTHDYHFVSPGDVLAARRLEKTLPPKPVLLSFDGGFVSAVERVAPLLALYGIPAAVSFSPHWIEFGPPDGFPGAQMTWDDVRVLGQSPLITLGVQPHDLFLFVQANPQGNTGFSALTRTYDSGLDAYETDTAFRERIRESIRQALKLTGERSGVRPRLLTWPHGARNGIGEEEALRLGIAMGLGLRPLPGLTDSETLDRVLIQDNPDVLTFIAMVKTTAPAQPPIRWVRLEMERLYAPHPERFTARLDQAAQRFLALGVTHVALRGCVDADRDGTAEAALFPTRVLPVSADILDHAVARLREAGLRVWISMPALSVDMPDTVRYNHRRVMEMHGGAVRPVAAPRRRLSPFHPDARETMLTLYRDLAAHVRMDGILVESDAYLTDDEDFNPAARALYMESTGMEAPGTGEAGLLDDAMWRWTQAKTEALNTFVGSLTREVQRFRRQALSARALVAPVLHHPPSEAWFAQNYTETLRRHDIVLVEAYAELESVRRPERWLRDLADSAAAVPAGLAGTLFELQAYDGGQRTWLDDGELASRFKALLDAAALHVGYTPDSVSGPEPAGRRVMRVLRQKP